jgi:hypothetical protein
MNKLTTLRGCAEALGIQPMTLSRWIIRYPGKITVHRISDTSMAMRPSTVQKQLTALGVYPTRTPGRPRNTRRMP